LKNRIHPLGAALALVQLRKLPERIAAREAHRRYFDQCASQVPGVEVLPTAANVTRGAHYRYLLRYVPEALGNLPIDRYVEALRAEGVSEVLPGALAKPLHLTRIFQTLEDRMYRSGWPRRGRHVARELVYKPGDFPEAERFSASTLQFPAFTEPSFPIIEAYCEAMRKVAAGSEELFRQEMVCERS
jgi:dTDP-4-amino-4,6-dideoxygalactose transaminase